MFKTRGKDPAEELLDLDREGTVRLLGEFGVGDCAIMSCSSVKLSLDDLRPTPRTGETPCSSSLRGISYSPSDSRSLLLLLLSSKISTCSSSGII